MIKTIINKYKNIDDTVKKIMINGFKFSFAIIMLSALILGIYHIYLLPIIYLCGTILFKSAIMFIVDFIILGIGFDTLKKQMV